MRSMRSLVSVLGASASMLVAASAFAQTATISTSGIQRKTSTGTVVNPRFVIDGKTPGLSRQDCLDDLVYDIPLVMTGLPTSYTLQAWAGSDCATLTARTGANPTCWPLLGSGIGVGASVNVKIRMQDIVAQMNTGGSPRVTSYTPATSSVCTSQTALGSGATSLGVSFLWIDGGSGNSMGTGATYTISVKLFGPDAPTNLAAGAGGGLLKLTWTAPSNQKDLLGYRIYTQAGGGDGGATDATTTTCTEGGVIDGGLDDSGDATTITVDASCTTTPVTNTCGGTIDTTKVTPTEVGGTVGGGTVSGLVDGQSYTVAVAGYDSYGNSGTLSNSICATPQDTIDFWDNYRNSGGTAGGGYCASGPTGTGGDAPWAFFAIGGFLCAAIVRRFRSQG